MITKPKSPFCDSTCQQAIQKAVESRLNATQAYLATQLPASQFPPESRLAKSVSIILPGQSLTFVAGNSQLINGHPITSTNRFAVGSTGKMLTATLVYQLEAMGKLKITDPLSKHLPQGFLPPKWQNITIDEALHMTGGMYDYSDVAFQKELIERVLNHNDTIYNPVDLINYAYNKGPKCKPEYDPDHTFTPSEGWCYSNIAYRILECMIEFVGSKFYGQSYQEQLQERILTPLGMNHTIYDPSINPATLPDMTHGYCALIPNQIFVDGTNSTSLISQAGGAGSHISTPEDMSIFTRALFSGKIFPLESRQFKEFTTVVCTNPKDGCVPGKEVPLGTPGDAYNAAWRRIIQRPGDPSILFASGGIGIQTTNMFYMTESGLTVTTCTNVDAVGGDLPDSMDNGLFGDIYRAFNINQDKSLRSIESRQSTVDPGSITIPSKPSYQAILQTNSVTPSIKPPEPIVIPKTVSAIQPAKNMQAEAPLVSPDILWVTSGASRLEPPAPIRWIASGLRSVGGFFSGLFSHVPSLSTNPEPSTALALDDSISDTVEISAQAEQPRFTNSGNSSAETVRAVVDIVNNAGAYLDLGRVLWNLGTNIHHWATTPSQPVKFLSTLVQNSFERQLDIIERKLQRERENLTQEEVKTLRDSIYDARDDFKEIIKVGGTAEEISALEKDLQYLIKDAFSETKEGTKYALTMHGGVVEKPSVSFALAQQLWLSEPKIQTSAPAASPAMSELSDVKIVGCKHC